VRSKEATGRRRRRWPWVVVGAVVLAVGALIVARQVIYRDQTRQVTTEQAVNRYRESTASSSTSQPAHAGTSTTNATSATSATTGTSATSTVVAPTTTASASAIARSLPAPGVYRYRTTGEESIDVLGGAHHTYPAQSTITVTPDGCGVQLRWDVLQERRDEWRLCVTPAGLVEPWALQYHEFFKQPDAEALVCPATTLLLPSTPKTGGGWNVHCTLAGDAEPQRFEVLGSAVLQVGTVSVPTTHVRQSVNYDGSLYEHTINDWWLAADGLPVRGVETKSSASPSPIGNVIYKEHYEIDLESLTPLR
jgi:hypothetical protein